MNKVWELDDKVKRIIGRYTQNQKGFVFIALAGIHGNERAGYIGLKNVFAQLKQLQPDFIGEFIGIAGNVPAIEKNVRFINKDLNRQWYREQIDRIEKSDRHELSDNEDIQQKELIELLQQVLKKYPTHPIILLDLHTTSAEGGAFVISNHLEWSIDLAKNLQVPVITGVENTVQGTTMNYFSDLGMTAIGFEAGRHENESSIKRMEAALWLTLKKLGCLSTEQIPNYEQHYEILQKLGHNKPDVVEFCYRHGIKPDDGFKMRLGYKNFQAIEKGEHLASDNDGYILAQQDGLILMPLYQEQGEDGFFIVN